MRPSTNTKLDTFDPQTPSEMLLWNEIKRLRTEVYILERERGIFPVSREPAPVTLDVHEINPTLNLRCVAELRANIDAQGRLYVEARAYGERGHLGFGYYVDPRDLPSARESCDILMEKHKVFIHEIAAKLLEVRDAS